VEVEDPPLVVFARDARGLEVRLSVRAVFFGIVA
jgi:hypothetical protein